MRLIDADELKRTRFPYAYSDTDVTLIQYRDVVNAINMAPTITPLKYIARKVLSVIRRIGGKTHV